MREPKRETSLELLHPLIRKDIKRIQPLLDKLDFGIFETWRSPTRQKWLYDKKRTTIKTLGYHSFGLAIDICTKHGRWWKWDYKDRKLEWMLLAATLKDLQYVWGGDWYRNGQRWDTPHFQLSFGLKLQTLRAGALPDTGHEDWGIAIRQRLGLS